jgi:hypothetical protein
MKLRDQTRAQWYDALPTIYVWADRSPYHGAREIGIAWKKNPEFKDGEFIYLRNIIFSYSLWMRLHRR